MRNLIAMVFVLALAAPAWSQSATTGSDTAERVFGAIEKKIIEDFFGEQAAEAGTTKKAKNKKAKNKGKSGELPPGLAMQLEKNGTLPPGLAKKELPPGLADRLPPTGDGLERLIVDDDVLLIETATGVILDIIKDIVVSRDN